jgi:hypothetical protein
VNVLIAIIENVLQQQAECLLRKAAEEEIRGLTVN